MSKFQVGQRVIRTCHFLKGVVEKGPTYTVSDVEDGENIIQLKEVVDTRWNVCNFELYQEPAQKTFNPKPGDIIVTEGAGNWVCVDKTDHRFYYYQDYDFFGIQGEGFQCWMSDGRPYREGQTPTTEGLQYAVKEIIPAASNNPVAIPQQPQDLSFQVKALELENQMLRKLLRREGVEV